MPRKVPLPQSEVEICKRLREFRLKTKLSQAAFANEIGIDSARLGSYEHARAPVQYSLFEKVAAMFKLSAFWLATGKGDLVDIGPIPPSEMLGMRDGALFSFVYEMELASGAEYHDYGKLPFPLHFNGDRSAILEDLRENLKAWLSRVPDARLDEFYQRLVFRGQAFSSVYGNDVMSQLIESRLVAELGKVLLTNPSEKHTTGDVMKPIPALKDVLGAVRKATAERGERAQLARRLKISQASLSEWLRGESEPGGEITLRLWKWVTGSKREH